MEVRGLPWQQEEVPVIYEPTNSDDVDEDAVFRVDLRAPYIRKSFLRNARAVWQVEVYLDSMSAPARKEVEDIKQGTEVVLVRRKGKQYHSNTIEVTASERGPHLGWVPQTLANKIAPAMDKGIAFYVAKVESTFTTVCATSIKTALGLRLVNL
jgi:hypothetical protein